MKIKLVERQNPLDRKQKKLYANPVNAGRKDLRAIAKDISGRSSLTRGDIENVLSNFLDELPKYLNDGYSVQLGYLGTMRVSLTSEGAATAKQFKTETIKPKIIFTPGTELRAEMEKISYRIEG